MHYTAGSPTEHAYAACKKMEGERMWEMGCISGHAFVTHQVLEREDSFLHYPVRKYTT
jgi:hypothetical protein